MPKASFVLASFLCLGMLTWNLAQEGNSQEKTSQTEAKKSEKQPAKAQDPNSSKKQTQKQAKPQGKQTSQRNQIVEAKLEDGQTIAIPAGGELLELTVATPKTVRSGQRYRYQARVQNVSQSTTLANVRLVQMRGASVDIEDSQLKAEKQSQKSQQQSQSKKSQQQKGEQKQQQKSKPQSQQKQSASRQQQSEVQQSTEGSNTVWKLGALKPGDSQVLAVTAIASETGRIDHCFSVRYEEVLCTQVEVIKPEVTIAKSGPEQVSVCELFEYRYELTNTGTGVAKNFVVRDPLPEGLMTKSGKSELVFRVPELKEGQTQAYVAEVHTMKPGTYASRATVEQDSGETRQSRQASTQVIAPKLDLQIEGPRAIKAGEGGNFDVTVTNTSDVLARNVVLTLNPDEDVQVTNAGKGDARKGGSSYRYSLGDLKPQENKRVSISLDSDKGGEMTLGAVAQALCARDQGKDVVVAEAEADLQSRVMRVTSLLISLVDTDDVIPKGETITYRLRVRNQGSFPDKNVKVNLNVPSGLKFQEVDGPSKAQANGQRVSLGTVEKIDAGETLEWNITMATQSTGEKIVEATLDSEGLNNTVETQEVSTIYDASKQKASGTQSSSSQKNSSDASENEKESDK